MSLPAQPALNLICEQYDGTNFRLRWSRPIAAFGAERAVHQQLVALPQVQFHAEKGVYIAPCVPATCLWLQKTFPQIVWEDADAELPYRFTLKCETGALDRAVIVTNWVTKREVPPVLDYVPKRPWLKHQQVGFVLARAAPFYGLTMDMGTGKTKTMNDVLSYLALHHHAKKPMRVLIVCPRSVMINWCRELAMDITVPYAVSIAAWVSKQLQPELESLNVVKTGGGDLGSLEAILDLFGAKDKKLQIAMVNYDALKGRLELLKTIGFDVVVLDESHRIKSNSSKRTKFCLELAETCTRRYILTGTPLTQNPMDLFPQFEFLGPKMGLLGYTTHYAYQSAYAQMSGSSRQRRVDGWQNLGQLMQYAAKWSFTVKKEDCLDLPEKIYVTRRVDMTEEQREIYDQVTEEVLLVLESLGAEMTVQNILVQYLRLAQVTSGYVKTVDGREVMIPGATAKVDELLDVLESAGWPQAVVWARFTHEIEAIATALEERGIACGKYYGATTDIQRDIIIDDFQKGKLKVFIGNAQAGGEGVNLTAASLVVYLSNDFSLQRRLQSEDRCHRIGQKSSVTYVDIVCADSIDEYVLEKLAAKRDMAVAFTDPTELANSLKDFLLAAR